MTTTEFNNEFDILYDNVSSKGAPGLDKYEKSVFLTKAQLEIVNNKYTALGNKYKKGFEGSEKRISDLKELISDYKTNKKISNDNNISNKSVFFEVPNNLYLIIYEDVKFKKNINEFDECQINDTILVVPKTHDEYKSQINNPFKKPDNNTVWRIGISKQFFPTESGKMALKNTVELVSEKEIETYKCRYIKMPNPIILTDLSSGDFLGMKLSIGGKTNEQTSSLLEHVHYEILNRAVELALLGYKDGTLKSNLELNSRNE